MKTWIIVSAIVLLLVLASSFYLIYSNGIYSKSELVSDENNNYCYNQVACRCLGKLYVAGTVPVLGYDCDGFEFCSDEVNQKCFDMNNYWGD